MAGRRLARAVHIGGTWYRAGDVVPDDVAERITNQKVFVTNDDTDDYGSGPATEAGTPSGARLTRRVSVGGQWYGPDDPVPADVAAQITNPAVWEGGKLPTAAAPPTTPNRAGPATEPGPDGDGGDEPPAGTNPDNGDGDGPAAADTDSGGRGRRGSQRR